MQNKIICSLLLLSAFHAVSAKGQQPISLPEVVLPETSLQKEVRVKVTEEVLKPLRAKENKSAAFRFSRVRMPSNIYTADVDKVAINGRVNYRIFNGFSSKNRAALKTGYYDMATKALVPIK